MTSPNQAALDLVEREVDRINTKLDQVIPLMNSMPTGSLAGSSGDVAGGSSGGGTTPSGPARPTGLTGSVQANRSVIMNWDPAADAGSWQVHELLKDPANTLKATVTSPTTTRGPLASGSYYRYGIVPVAPDGITVGPMSLTIDVNVGTSGGTVTTTTAGSTSTTQLGKTTDGPSSSASTGDKTSVSQVTAGASGVLTAGHARLWITSGTATTTKLVLYADASGVPGAKLAESDVLTVSGTTEAQRDYTFSGANQVNITQGTVYWVGASWQKPGGAGGTDSVNISRDGTTGGRSEVSSFAPATFGTATVSTGPVDVFLDVVATTAGTTSTKTYPAELFDLRYWYLTLPIADTTGRDTSGPWDVYQPDLATFTEPTYFHLGSDANGAYVEMYAPAQGVTTSSASGATRCEYREMASTDGTTKAAWSWSDGKLHSLTVTMTCDATSVEGRKECIVGQAHGASGTPPLYLAVNQNSMPGKITVFRNGASASGGDILAGQITGTTLFTYKILKTAANHCQLFYCLGTAASLPATPQFDWVASDFSDTTGLYFKAGAYNKQDISTAGAGGSLVRHYRCDLVTA